ncbi:disease resistance protein RGA5-like [Triticum dicoccoides]|uniref:disease resistance protein RGA5-like n=1 Tax=Triticum dicoccoides TaxID=85692 RepID=UPI000E799D56|nr:disease resistance protein RGA5-like [Triticum dicoccoides]
MDAEGFVSNLHGTNLEDVGISYFNELVNRSLIQPADKYGQVCCKVHDMMLDLILSKCAEDNFSSVAYTSEDIARLCDRTYKIRRLSLISRADITSSETISWTVSDSTSQVWSLVCFGGCKSIPRLSQLKYIRVLSFECPNSFGDSHVDLTAISQLFQLRYLKVSEHYYPKLPTEIRGLVHLDTLDVARGSIPSDIEHLPRLSNLAVGWYGEIGLPERIGIMESLRTLHGFELQRSPLEALQGLGNLTNLRSLKLFNLDDDECNLLEKAAKFDALVSSIFKLRNLKYLMMRGHHDGITILGGLPSLVHLELQVVTFPKEEAVIMSKGLFPVLERLTFLSDEDVITYLRFEAGAMPKLQELSVHLRVPQWGGAAPVGTEHLLALQQISLLVFGTKKESRE